MHGYLGLDTSNYTTSCAILCNDEIRQQKRLLPVPRGQLGLRHSDAVFLHVKALGELVTELMQQCGDVEIRAVGASKTPRDTEGSYMPCFLTGVMAAQALSAAMRIPVHTVSHQAGHVAAALYGAHRTDWIGGRFLAFHVSGGTTECLLVERLTQGKITLLSSTADLNAGQLVDRVGAMLELSFPAGEALEALAMQSAEKYDVRISFVTGNPCLSGVENQCRALLEKGCPPQDVARYCLDAILAALIKMARDAVARTGCADLLFAGGVMSNGILRAELQRRFNGIFAPREYACDNAAGVALLTALHEEEAVGNRNER